MRRLLLMGLGLLAAALVAYAALYQAVERQAVLDETRNADATIVLEASVEWGEGRAPAYGCGHSTRSISTARGG